MLFRSIDFPQVDERFSVAELLTGVFGSRTWVAQLEAPPPKPVASSKASVLPKPSPVTPKSKSKTRLPATKAKRRPKTK